MIASRKYLISQKRCTIGMLNFFSVLFSMYLLCSCNPTKNLKPNELFLQKNKVSIIDHQKLEKEELKKLFKQKTNKEILGIFKFHLFIYFKLSLLSNYIFDLFHKKVGNLLKILLAKINNQICIFSLIWLGKCN